jgi:predicted homoserine dehydrogenase-like protein
MAVLANAINGKTAVPGMLGHRASSIHDIFKLYDFNKLWDGKRPLVDYMLGAEPKGGVFVIGHTQDKFQQNTLGWFPPDIGTGPFYLFYRPYYLGHIEAMQCVAEAYLEGTARLQPACGMKTNVFSYAKRDLKQGDILDGKGGKQCYGLIENLEDAGVSTGLPILISNNLRLKRDIVKDERITLEDVAFDAKEKSFQLYFEASGIASPSAQKNELPSMTETYQFV